MPYYNYPDNSQMAGQQTPIYPTQPAYPTAGQQPTSQVVYPDWWPRPQEPKRPEPTPQQQSVLPGRWVESEKDISPREVPMDNSVGVFPLSDFSGILLKKWENNGTITTVLYEPKIVPQGPTPEETFQTNVQERLGKMEDMLGVLMNLWQVPSQPDDDKEEQK